MAKQRFTIAHDVRIAGVHIAAGSPIELDPDTDSMTINNLLASGRIVETREALEAVEKSKANRSFPPTKT